MLPRIDGEGTLVADPSLRFTSQGVAVCSGRLAFNSRKKEGDTWVDGDPTFLSFSVWRQMAENCAEVLVKGMKVTVTGTLKQRDYEKDGVTHTTFEIDVENIGPSLRFDTFTKNGSGGKGGAADSRPWSTGAAATQDDEPPF